MIYTHTYTHTNMIVKVYDTLNAMSKIHPPKYWFAGDNLLVLSIQALAMLGLNCLWKASKPILFKKKKPVSLKTKSGITVSHMVLIEEFSENSGRIWYR